MTSGWHRRLAPVMWGAIGVTFMVLVVVVVYGLDHQITGYAVGALVLVCIAVCGAAFWLDSRATRATGRLVDQLRRSDEQMKSAGPDLARASSPDRDLRPY